MAYEIIYGRIVYATHCRLGIRGAGCVAHGPFQLFGLLLKVVELGNVTGYVARAHRQRGEILQVAVFVYRHGGGFGTEVHEHASETFLVG